jgi:predicted nucleotidyltransferase component of viral defense system
MVVERDYVLSHIVDALARSNPPQGLVFKGGTALRLCFYEEFRYSADLDSAWSARRSERRTMR